MKPLRVLGCEGYSLGCAIIVHADGAVFIAKGARMVGADTDNAEGAALGHTGVRALAVADGQGGRGLVPGKRYQRIGALLISIGRAVVVVEREATVATGIDVDGQRSIGLLG